VSIPDEDLDRYRGIIHSMTMKERRDPELIEASRRRRIARGAGVDQQLVSALVKQFIQMRGLMKQMSGMGMFQRMKVAQSLSHSGLLEGAIPKVKGSTRYDPRKRDRKKKRRR
jgi:signal recognition particle subunit SRP54